MDIPSVIGDLPPTIVIEPSIEFFTPSFPMKYAIDWDWSNIPLEIELPAIQLPPLNLIPGTEGWPEFAEPDSPPLPDDFKLTELEEEFPGIPSYVPFWEEKLRELAFLKWEAAGCPNDMSNKFWFEAQTELKKFCENL